MPASVSRTPPPGTTFIQPRTPYDPATRPMPINRSGGLFCKLFDEALGRGRELRAPALPVLHALEIDAQRLAAFRGLGIVEAETLEELARGRAPRVRHHEVEKRTLVGAAAPESNHYHLGMLRKPRKGADYTGNFCLFGRLLAPGAMRQ